MKEPAIPGTTSRSKLGLAGIALCCLVPGTAIYAQTPEPTVDPSEPTVKLDDVENVASDDNLVMPTEPTRSVFGLNMSLAETPRSANIVNATLLDNLGIRNTEDLIKVSPSTYSNFRFGLQGNVSIRNQTSDFYFRGMRRIDPQGNFRTLWTANDSLEIVRGPSSPIFGMGRIGGYVNFNPKTARASTGKYFDKPTGQVRVTMGSFDKKIMTAEVGGPVNIPVLNKQGGYHVYVYNEDSGSYKVNSFDIQRLAQGTVSFNVNDTLRVEAGAVLQFSNGGLPGGINRTIRTTSGRNSYWDGGFSYQLDSNRDGMISEREVRDSYFYGTAQVSVTTNDPFRQMAGVSSGNGPSLIYNGQNNDPLFRSIPWQGRAFNYNGSKGSLNPSTITMAQFQTGYTQTFNAAIQAATGLPASMQRQGYQLMVYPTINITLPNGKVDAVTNYNGTPSAFFLPPAFDLDAASWKEKPLNKRMSFGEDYYKAHIGAYFVDFIQEISPDSSIKNQTLMDGHHQVKDGRNPFSQFQEVFTLENKTTYERKFTPADWLKIDTAASGNVFYLDTYRVSTVPTDIDFRRSLVHNDADRVEDTFTPNDTFYSMVLKRGYDGSPPSFTAKSNYTNAGVGVVANIGFFEKINLMLGARYDFIDVETLEPAGTYQKGGATNPGAPYSVYAGTGLFTPVGFYAADSDKDYSWTASLSYNPIKGITIYGTYADQSLIVNNASAQEFSVRPVLTGQILGRAAMAEGGAKFTLLKNKLFATVAWYNQERISFDAVSTVGGAASSTLSRGWESDLRFVMNKKWTFIAGGSFSQAKYLQGGTISIDARTAGFPDVVDAAGNVVIPAEAFGWGGRLSTNIPDSEPDFREVEGIPDRVVNFTTIFTPTEHWVFQTTVFHQGTFATDRLHTINVERATTLDALIGYRTKKWELNLNVTNVFNTEIWNKGSFYWLDPKFPQAVELSWVYKF
jgi:iron complex outermembrane receptor protein